MSERIYVCYYCKKVYAISDSSDRTTCPKCGSELIDMKMEADNWQGLSSDRQQEILDKAYNQSEEWHKLDVDSIQQRPYNNSSKDARNISRENDTKPKIGGIIAVFAIIAIAIVLVIAIKKYNTESASGNSDSNVDTNSTTQVVEIATGKADKGKDDNDSSEEQSIEDNEHYYTSNEILDNYLNDALLRNENLINDLSLTAPYVFVKWDEEWETTDVRVGNFGGEEGIIGYKITDLNVDGEPELLVIRRKSMSEEDIYGFPDGNVTWIYSCEVFYVEQDNVKSSGEVVLDKINDSSGEWVGYRAQSMEGRFFLKEIKGNTEICSSTFYGSPIGADGFCAQLTTYLFDGNKLYNVTHVIYEGSDAFNDDLSFSQAAEKSGLYYTAEQWKNNDGWTNEGNGFLVTEKEPDCIDLLCMRSDTNFSYEVLWNRPRGPFDDYQLSIITENLMNEFNYSASSIAEDRNIGRESQENSEELIETMYGTKFYIPAGFIDVSPDFEGYERNNAAGGFSHWFMNDKLGMKIEVDEFVWANIFSSCSSPAAVISSEYDSIDRSNAEDQWISDDWYMIKIRSKGEIDYTRVMVGDYIYHSIHITYPTNNENECKNIAGQFIDTFEISQ